MSYGVSIVTKVNNLPILQRELKNLVKVSLRDTGREMAQAARAKAPIVTGALRASIYVSSPAGSSYNFALHNSAAIKPEIAQRAIQRTPSPGGAYVIIGAVAWYAAYIEFGHMSRGGGTVPAQSFLFSSVIGKMSVLKSKISEAIVNVAENGASYSTDINDFED